MDKMISFMEAKADRDGKVTPRAMVESVIDEMNNPNTPEIKKAAIVVMDENGMIHTAASSMEYVELIGLHEIAKAIAIEEMDEEI